jgi:phage terminase large subunit-like protein
MDPEDFAHVVMNPLDNPHLPEAYLKQLKGLSTLQRKRFLEGEYLTDMPGSLWKRDMLDAARGKKPGGERRRTVVGVDPSGGAGERGIVVAAQEGDDDYVVLQDASGMMSAKEYGVRVVQMADKWDADAIVVEKNFGGDMAEAVITNEDPSARVIMVTATRGKHIRAEPISALYEKNRVRHEGQFQELEDQMTQITANGWEGEGDSPDRLDALVWALTELNGDDSTPAFVALSAKNRR